MATTITPQEDTSNRKRKIMKFALAGVAVLGVGAALTSAAWSDSVFFAAPSSAAAFELQGYNPTSGLWDDADTAGVAIQLPADAIDAVGPGISDSYTVQVRNYGDINITLGTPTSTTTGLLFAGALPATVSFGSYVEAGSDGVLAPNEVASIDVIVTGRNGWTGTDYQGLSGTVTVQIQGQS
jgi:hypothetical protein